MDFRSKEKGVIGTFAILILLLCGAVMAETETTDGDVVDFSISSVTYSYDSNADLYGFVIVIQTTADLTANVTLTEGTTTIGTWQGQTLKNGGNAFIQTLTPGHTYSVNVNAKALGLSHDASFTTLSGFTLADLMLKEGKTGTPTVTPTPSGATNLTMTWSSSNSSVATVNANGLVTGVSVGTAIITAVSTEGSSIKDTCTVTVVSAVQYTITASAGTGGSISPAGSIKVDEGSGQTFRMVPASGYAVDTLTVDGSAKTPATSYTFSNVTGNHSIAVTFKQIYTITASAGTGGSISPAGSVTLSPNGSQTFTITAKTGYAIGDVLVDGVSQGAIASYTFSNVTANHTIKATFTGGPGPSTTYTITASAGTGGTVTPATAKVAYGGSATFTVTPDSGYTVSKVLLDNTAVTLTDGKYTVSNVTAAHTLSVTFAKDVKPVIDINGGGSISPSGGTYPAGTSVTFTVTPDSGYTVSKVLVNGTEVPVTDGKFTVTVTDGMTVDVEFASEAGPSSGSNVWTYVAVAIVVIAAAGAAVFLFLRKTH